MSSGPSDLGFKLLEKKRWKVKNSECYIWHMWGLIFPLPSTSTTLLSTLVLIYICLHAYKTSWPLCPSIQFAASRLKLGNWKPCAIRANFLDFRVKITSISSTQSWHSPFHLFLYLVSTSLLLSRVPPWSSYAWQFLWQHRC